MTVKVSVVVPFSESSEAIATIVRSLDAQTLTYAEFETIFVNRGSTDGTDLRLARLAGRRPNVTIVQAEAAPVADISGEYVLRLAPDDDLFDDGLSRLYSHAQSADAAAVRGLRVGDPSMTGSVVAYRTALLREHDVDITADDFPERIGALGIDALLLRESPVLRGSGSDPAGDDTRLVVYAADLDWDADCLSIRFEAQVGHTADTESELSARLLAEHRPSGRQVQLPAIIATDAVDDGTRLTGQLRLTFPSQEDWIRPGGTWHLRLEVLLGGEEQLVAPLRANRPISGVIGADIVGLEDSRLGLGLYRAAARTHFFAPVAEDASFVESAAGNKLTLPLARVHGHRAEALGYLDIGSISVPGILTGNNGHLALESWVSGMAGSYPLAARFGGPAVPLNLHLKVGPLGELSLVTPPPPPPPPRPASPPPPPRSAPPRSAPPRSARKTSNRKPKKRRRPLTRLQKLRRRLPEPLVRLSRRIPGLEATYGNLIRRSRARDST